jgi:hypothetical protein
MRYDTVELCGSGGKPQVTRRWPVCSRFPWLPAVIFVIAAVLSAAGIGLLRKAEARNKREATYQAALGAYSHDPSPGLARKEVESYLRARNTSFRQVCCGEAGDYADLIQVGRGNPPWFCSESYVYVAIEFAAVERHDSFLEAIRRKSNDSKKSPIAYDSDILTKVEMYRPDIGCL